MASHVTRFSVTMTGSIRVMSPIVTQAIPWFPDVQLSESAVEGVAPAISFTTCFSRGAGQSSDSADNSVRRAKPALRESQDLTFKLSYLCVYLLQRPRRLVAVEEAREKDLRADTLLGLVNPRVLHKG